MDGAPEYLNEIVRDGAQTDPFHAGLAARKLAEMDSAEADLDANSDVARLSA